MGMLLRKPVLPAVPEVRLAVKPDWAVYRAHSQDLGEANGEPELLQELQRSFRSTSLRPLKHPQEVMLDQDCRVLRTFHYSTPALSAVCRLLGRGLTQLVFDLGGVERPGSVRRPVDLEMAMRIFNDTVKLRFDTKLKGRQLVMDRQYARIDGLVGPRYELYQNLELYEHANQWLAKGPVPVKFHEAILMGRRLALRYRTESALFEVPTQRKTGEPFFGGYHLGNSETGDYSIRAAVVIIRQWCDNKALAEFAEGGRVNHIRSKQFEQRLYRLLERVQLQACAATTLKGHVLRLMAKPLGLGQSEENQATRSQQLLQRLERFGMSTQLAKRVFERMLTSGSYRADSVVEASLRKAELWEQYSRRTEYDVFNAITFVAKALSMDSQERLERLAYQLMLGKISLVQPKEKQQ